LSGYKLERAAGPDVEGQRGGLLFHDGMDNCTEGLLALKGERL